EPGHRAPDAGHAAPRGRAAPGALAPRLGRGPCRPRPRGPPRVVWRSAGDVVAAGASAVPAPDGLQLRGAHGAAEARRGGPPGARAAAVEGADLGEPVGRFPLLAARASHQRSHVRHGRRHARGHRGAERYLPSSRHEGRPSSSDRQFLLCGPRLRHHRRRRCLRFRGVGVVPERRCQSGGPVSPGMQCPGPLLRLVRQPDRRACGAGLCHVGTAGWLLPTREHQHGPGWRKARAAAIPGRLRGGVGQRARSDAPPQLGRAVLGVQYGARWLRAGLRPPASVCLAGHICAAWLRLWVCWLVDCTGRSPDRLLRSESFHVVFELGPQVVLGRKVRGRRLRVLQPLPHHLDGDAYHCGRHGGHARCVGRNPVQSLVLPCYGGYRWKKLLPVRPRVRVRPAPHRRLLLGRLGMRHDLPHGGEHGDQVGAHVPGGLHVHAVPLDGEPGRCHGRRVRRAREQPGAQGRAGAARRGLGRPARHELRPRRRRGRAAGPRAVRPAGRRRAAERG
ncbi:unnamed protein product, partial [Prorocentrum cordatum]